MQELSLLKPLDKNNNLNLFLLNHLSEKELGLSAKNNGVGTINYQLTHLYNVRFWKLEVLDKKLCTNLKTYKKDELPPKEKLANLFNQTNVLMKQHLSKAWQLNLKKLKGHPGDVFDFVTSIIEHEAHHRGNIMLCLRLHNMTLDKEIKHKLWTWSKADTLL